MDKLKQTINTWLNSKTQSEKQLIKLASLFFILFLVIILVTTINKNVAESEKKLTQQIELNSWAKQQITVIQQANKSLGKTQSNKQSITQVINSTAKRYNVLVERIQPQKDDLVKVGIDEIGFNNLMNWLTELETKHSINVQNIDFSKADSLGVVKIRRLDLGRE
jgi:general secretion pathway protein M